MWPGVGLWAGPALQGLELVHPLLGVAHADLPQGLVLVPPLALVVRVQQVVAGLLAVVAGLG